MTIYFLRLYSSDDKGRFEIVTLGVFTSKTKLISAIKKNADLLGLDDCEGFRAACRDMFGQLGNMSEVGEYLNNGYVAEVDANKIYPDGI